MTEPRRATHVIMPEALQWGDFVRDGDLVVWGQASAEPVTLTASLMAQRAALPPFRAFIGIGFSTSVDAAHGDRVSFASYCGTGINRSLGESLSIWPVPYERLSPLLARQKPIVLLSLAPGADADHFSFGAGADYIADLIENARLVIAEVSSRTPRTGKGRDMPRARIDIVVESDAAPATAPAPRLTTVDRAIARRVADLIPNGATLQIGLGAIPAAVLEALSDHRDLGIHSGLIGDEVAMLVEAGIITNARKPIDPGLTTCGVLAGGSALIRWADNNRTLALRSTRYTHDPAVLRAIDGLVAVNSAIEVDLTGQVNAEVAGGRYVGAIGGAGAFLRGAHAACGGLPIIALPSTAGTSSRIVARLNGPVSTTRADAGIIVTEHGVADLRNADLAQRRAMMLALCDPAHHDAVEAAG